MPSLIRNVTARAWSAMIFCRSRRSSACIDVLATGGCAAMISVKRSVSYIEALPLQTASIRSSPAPVSIDFFGKLGQLAVGAAIVLLEDDIPNLDVPIA